MNENVQQRSQRTQVDRTRQHSTEPPTSPTMNVVSSLTMAKIHVRISLESNCTEENGHKDKGKRNNDRRSGPRKRATNQPTHSSKHTDELTGKVHNTRKRILLVATMAEQNHRCGIVNGTQHHLRKSNSRYRGSTSRHISSSDGSGVSVTPRLRRFSHAMVSQGVNATSNPRVEQQITKK